jgi:ATP-binding cassette subfamily G (WHITE) protein 2
MPRLGTEGAASSDGPLGISIALRGLSVTVAARASRFTPCLGSQEPPTPHRLLSGITATFPAGTMTALMGPSGAGKTTLLDVMAGRMRTGRVTGEVHLGGAKPTRSALRAAVGYVEQFDTLIGELTVRDMLMYTAQLRLPVSMATAAKRARVQEVIDGLALGTCAEVVIGSLLRRGLSGGQAKRVNIALSLLTCPHVLFLDEPTSGLDSSMANEVAACLAGLARKGHTVVCTIHSPSAKAFARFDELLLLQGGRVIFGGPVDAAMPYFELVTGRSCPVAELYFSLPEWLLDVTTQGGAAPEPGAPASAWSVSSAPPIAFADVYAGSELVRLAESRAEAEAGAGAGARGAPGARLDKPGAGWQLSTLLRYRAVGHYQTIAFLGPRICDKVLFGVLILTLYWGIGSKADAASIQSTASLLYIVSALCGYGAASFVPSLILERPLFYRELADGNYTAPVYYLAKLLEEAALASLTSFVFAATIFFGVGLQGSFWIVALTYFVTTMSGICLAYAVAALVPSMDAANALLPAYVTTCVYFGGLFLVFDKIPSAWRWYSWTSFLRYSWGAQMLNQYGNTTTGGYGAYHDDETGRTLTVLEFYACEGPVMGSLGACLALLALSVLLFAAIGVLSLSTCRHASR